MIMPQVPIVGILAFVALLVGLSTSQAQNDPTSTLPIIFFHGATANSSAGDALRARLETEARPFVALSFCEGLCSALALPMQVPLAIQQIRAITKNDTRFDKGYVIIGHSQGGAIARAVIEEMDDHKARAFVSLAGAQNGLFFGPQPSDALPAQVFIKMLGPKMIPKDVMDFNYTNEQLAAGKHAIDFINLMNAKPTLQDTFSFFNLPRSPVHDAWVKTSKFLPALNNIDPVTSPEVARNHERRKANFLRLEVAHFFASPSDEVIAPWQSSILGQYQDVPDMATLAAEFRSLQVLPMRETREYVQDTYGLQTLDHRGGLFLHMADKVWHSCWVKDAWSMGSTEKCLFTPVFEQHLMPILGPKPSAL